MPTVEELKQFLRTNNVRGYSGKNKEQLLQMVEEFKNSKSNIEDVNENLYEVLGDLVFDYIPLNDFLELMKINPKIYTEEKYLKLQAKVEKELADQLSAEFNKETDKALKYMDNLIIEKKMKLKN